MDEIHENEFGEYATLLIGSGKYKTEFTKKFTNRKNWEAPNPKQIHAFIPGTIIDVLIKPGQVVKEGETILILEAMKMQNQVAMPFDGKIKSVYVKADEKIAKYHLMVEIA